MLDLDHFRAEVGKHSAGERSSDQRPQLQHPDVRQRTAERSIALSFRIAGHDPSILDRAGGGQGVDTLGRSIIGLGSSSWTALVQFLLRK
jgi:hypothetical protein